MPQPSSIAAGKLLSEHAIIKQLKDSIAVLINKQLQTYQGDLN